MAADLLRRFALQAIGGALVWAATPGLGDQWGLAGVALCPLLLSLHGCGAWRAFALGLTGGLLYIIPGKWPAFSNAAAALGHGEPATTGLVLAFFAAFALPFMAYGMLAARFDPRMRHPLSAWLTGFALSALILLAPTIFPFTPAVMISAQPALNGIAAFGGEPLLLAMLLTVNAGVAQWFLGGPRVGACAAIALPIVMALAYPPQTVERGAEDIGVLALQSRWPSQSGDAILFRDSRRGRPLSAIELTRAGLREAPACDLVVWPESPRVVGGRPDPGCRRAAALSQELGRPIVATCRDSSTGGDVLGVRLLDGRRVAETHRKSRLIPLFEEQSAVERHPGPRRPVWVGTDLPAFAPAICYEVHFRHDLRAAAGAGAQFLVHLASFGPFRDSGISAWDLAMTRLRAVETGRAIVRSVNLGTAGMVLPDGRWEPTAAPGASGARCHRAPLSARTTPYTKLGDWPFWLLLLVITGLRLAAAAGRARPYATGQDITVT